MRVRQLVAGAALALVAAGCSSGSTLDAEQLQEEITTGIEEQTGLPAEISCPADRPLEAGDVFDCTATFDDGTEQSVTITQTDDQGNVNWELGP